MKKYIKKAWAALKRQAKVNPIQIGLAGAVVLVLLAQLSLVGHQVYQEKLESNRIMALTQVSLRDLAQRAEQGEIKTIVSHQVRAGSLLIPQQRSYLEIIDAQGKHWGVETSSTPGNGEELGKMLFGAARQYNIQFKVGQTLAPLATDRMFGIVMMVLLFILLIGLAQKFSAEMLGGASFRPQKPNLDQTLDDVIGYEQVKVRLREIRDGLLNYDEESQTGLAPPKGLLLTGGPGVGKSLMARCLANELAADFFVASGADFAEMYVGVGPRRVRSLFKMARMSRMAVIFIDEIDALGSRATMGNDSERLATLNQLLAEMDGTNGNGRLIVVGATNAEDRMDPALLRAGRFDLKILVPPPDTQTRRGILEYNLRGRPLQEPIDLDALALRTQGYSGAELRNLVEEAARLAAREAGVDLGGKRNTWAISQDDLLRAQEISRLGVDTPSAHADDRVRVAVHELGHALLGWTDNPDILIEKVTINGRGQALGYAWSRPLEERRLIDHEQAQGRLRMMLAGRAAEEAILGTVSAGASDDLRKAQDLATHLVVDFGIGERSGLSRPVQLDSYGREVLTEQGRMDAAELVSKAYAVALKTIWEQREWLVRKAERLVEAGTLSGEELFENLSQIRGGNLTEGQLWAKRLAWQLAQNSARDENPHLVPDIFPGELVPAVKNDEQNNAP